MPIINTTTIDYVPGATDNPSVNYNQYVVASNGKTYYIDNTGKSILIESAAKAAVARLSPVLDFSTTDNIQNIDPLILTDGDSYIITTADDNKSDIAIWDEVNQVWIYYTPKNNDVTTITTGIHAGESWIYNLAGDVWIQDTTTTTNSTEIAQPLVGNLMLGSRNQSSSQQGFALIQNSQVTVWGAGTSIDYGTNTQNNTSELAPRRMAWSWNNLSATISRSAQYIPVFVDVQVGYNSVFALDSNGKLWASSPNTGL